jgi:hypothetical protein
MSSVFNEALERASNPQMPPPKSPLKTPTSPSRTSVLFQDKIRETVVTVPGMPPCLAHLGPAFSILCTKLYHQAPHPHPAPPPRAQSQMAVTSTQAALSHPSPSSPPLDPRDYIRRSPSRRSGPTRPTTHPTKSTGLNPLHVSLRKDRLYQGLPCWTQGHAAISAIRKPLPTRSASAISRRSGRDGWRSWSQLLTRYTMRRHCPPKDQETPQAI